MADPCITIPFSDEITTRFHSSLEFHSLSMTNPQKGDGHNVTDLKQKFLRENIGFVQQKYLA